MVQSAHMANRLGYGLRGFGASDVNPKAELGRYAPRPASLAALPTRAEVAGELADFYANRRAGDKDDKAAKMEMRRAVAKEGRGHYAQMVAARFAAAVESETPFAERLVHFWANHFAVSAERLGVVALAGLLEFEAVRPNVMGRFEDMLLAVEQHPAMLLYLDQAQSIGPNSQVATRQRQRSGKARGLNENLAREILELHTLGVRTGYSQADVTEFAKAMTGWTVAGIVRGPAQRTMDQGREPGDFVFAPQLHEPGARQLLGKSYGQAGVQQAASVLRDLALHPATARHLATKLARHFASDDPPAALVSRIERRFLETRGDLRAVYQALLDSPELWAAQAGKFKTPWDWLVSAYRALGLAPPDGNRATQWLAQLGQATWRAQSPAGYDDKAASWAAPDPLFRRVELAERLAAFAGTSVDPRKLAQHLFGNQVSDTTMKAIERAESPMQGTALLLVSPEFLRR